MIFLILICVVSYVRAETTNDSYKDQYCTDPRTMKKHAAYTEWADAYSCTRHRCQPGGRNLAIYTVGCKRVEAPESAIECEEVVEDTNMQFPYCCTRLRCLVVVRGEVWTRVLGQPWETLPAAPWSHMYKMKKPPPGNEFLPKNANEGPVYELNESDNEKPREKVLRASKQGPRTAETPDPNCNDVVPRAVPSPDIVIALTTNNDHKDLSKLDKDRKHHVKPQAQSQYYEEDNRNEEAPAEPEEPATEKPVREPEGSEEGRDYYGYSYGGVTQKPKGSHHHASWTEIPPGSWNEPEKFEGNLDQPEILQKQQQQLTQYQDFRQDRVQDHGQDQVAPEGEKKSDKPGNLQALVNAIGTRMRDIENVVQRMSEKVHQGKPVEEPEISLEKGGLHESDISLHNNEKRPKRPNPDGDQYKRFSVRTRGSSKYLHGGLESTSEPPVFVDDNANANGYFSDASNSVLRRANPRIEPKMVPKEPAPTYMAPVDNRRKGHPSPASEEKLEKGKKHHKRVHKKKRGRGKPHKKHRKDDKKRRFNSRVNSVENDRILISLEDSSAVNSN